ncbi:MAG TPA: hypothetical protein VES19_15010 [Candidatus Limnocylindrales bacterium]|nr:hypothetical protein [Candidatus Limnocylindrales bacterium]
MSFEEKGTWLYAVIQITLATVYGVIVFGQVPGTPVTQIDYQVPLIAAVVATVVVMIAGYIGIAISAPQDADKADQRDRDINRLGQYAGGTVLGFAMIVPLGLTLVEAPYFWIANTMYFGFVVSALVGTAVKLVLYRRGF